MNRRDRAQLVVAEIEARAERGELTRELVNEAVARNATGPSDVAPLGREVLRQLLRKGYDVADPGTERLWAWAGAALLPAALAAAWLLDWYRSVI